MFHLLTLLSALSSTETNAPDVESEPPAPPDPQNYGDPTNGVYVLSADRASRHVADWHVADRLPLRNIPVNVEPEPVAPPVCTRTGCGAPGTWRPVLMMMGLKWRGPFPLPLDIHVCEAHKAELEPQLLTRKTWNNGVTPMWNEMLKRQGLQVGKHKPARHLLKIAWEEVVQSSPAMSRPPAPPVDIRPEPTLDVDLGMRIDAPLPIGMEEGERCNRTHDEDGDQLYEDGSPCTGIMQNKDVSDICNCFDRPPCDAHSKPLPVECPECRYVVESD